MLAPVLVSVTLLLFAIAILYQRCYGKVLKAAQIDWLIFCISGLIVVSSFCIAGQHITKPDFQAYFYWPLFAAGHTVAIACFLKCLLRKRKT